MLELDRRMYCITEGAEGIWHCGQVGSRGSAEIVPHVSNNAVELQRIVWG